MRQIVKPLGGKSYGSIPHLPGSRLGPGDHHCHEGQARIATEKPRDKHDRIIVTEKLDGSNVAVARVDGNILAIIRAGYLCEDSPHKQHHIFAAWVRRNENRFALLRDGQRIVGEWLYLAHGTKYDLKKSDDLFIPFDVIGDKGRFPHDEARDLFNRVDLRGANVIYDGAKEKTFNNASLSIIDALVMLGPYGSHGAQEQVEGAVWRVERHGKFDFMVKFVRHDKVDGKYFKDASGNQIEVYNFSTKELFR